MIHEITKDAKSNWLRFVYLSWILLRGKEISHDKSPLKLPASLLLSLSFLLLADANSSMEACAPLTALRRAHSGNGCAQRHAGQLQRRWKVLFTGKRGRTCSPDDCGRR